MICRFAGHYNRRWSIGMSAPYNIPKWTYCPRCKRHVHVEMKYRTVCLSLFLAVVALWLTQLFLYSLV